MGLPISPDRKTAEEALRQMTEASRLAMPLPQAMTEERIERSVERAMDALDARLMAGKLTQAQYDENVRELNRNTEAQYSKVRR